MKERTDKPNFIKIRNFSMKNNVNKMRRQITDWKKDICERNI
jgi:hypothetical protein